uniref:peptidylprolyl isomerase n=1 Tax=Eutreptiella gymnastica TaxID=73025 RepID=A0A7S4GCQ1_9EUGL
MKLRPDLAPQTCQYISKIVSDGLYNGCCFYRADFVIQAGLTKATGGNVANPYGRLTVNESKGHNGRGSVAIAHWDCVEGCGTSCTKHAPDCGGSEWFINLKDNAHLDTTWGGYCVFAEVADGNSMQVVDAIEKAKKSNGQNIPINRAVLQ